MASDPTVRRLLKSGFLYFLIVFACGFLLGLVRVPFVEPVVGRRWAELAEMPVMLAVIYFVARWVVSRLRLPARFGVRIGTGLSALAFMVIAELVTAWIIGGMAPLAYIAGRDPVSGSVYLAMLLVYALMPVWVRRNSVGDKNHE